MTELAQQLDQKLKALDPNRAKKLEDLIRKAIEEMDRDEPNSTLGWPEGYFETTAGAFAGEEFEREDQGQLPVRDW